MKLTNWPLMLIILSLTTSTFISKALELGTNFVYEYTGRVSTGVADRIVNQVAGFTLKATLEVQWQMKERAIFFKLSNVKISEFNQKIDTFFSSSDLIETIVADEKIQEFIDELEEPIWISAGDRDEVNIEHGHLWNKSSNFKLSITSLFQIILKKGNNVYTVLEEGTTGHCPVTYETSQQLNSINITKTILFEKCEAKPQKLRTSIYGSKCTYCEQNFQNPLKTLGKTDYQIKMETNHDGFEFAVFEKIVSTGAIIFSPFGHDGYNVISVTNQTIVLKEVTEKSTEKPKDFIAESVDNFLFLTLDSLKTDALKEAEEKLPELIKDFHQFDNQSLSIMEFVLIFRQFTFNNFESFFESHVNLNIAKSTIKEAELRISLLQALSMAGTEASLDFILKLITEKKITRSLAAELIRKVPFHLQEPSHKLILNFTIFIQSKALNEMEDGLHEASWLSFGSLIKNLCALDSLARFSGKPMDSETAKKCSYYFQFLTDEYHAATSDKRKFLVLRAIQNTHLPGVVAFSTSVVKSQIADVFRRTAVWGLMQAENDRQLQKVLSILTQIAFNTSEDYLLRVYAFEALLYGDPSPELFAKFVVQLQKEPNEQIASYIYSTLVTMANATDPCLQLLSENARDVLRFVKPRRYDLLRYSTNKVFSYFNTKYGLGRTSQIVYIANNESLLPREVYIGHSLKLLGLSFNMLEMTLNPSDLDESFDRYAHLLNKPGLAGSPRLRNTNPHSFLLKIYKLLSKPHKRARESLSRIIVKYFGKDVLSSGPFGSEGQHCVFEQNSFKENPNQLSYDILTTCMKFSFTETKFTMTNSMGFPTTIQLHLPFVYKMGLKANGSMSRARNPFTMKGDFHFNFGTNFIVHTSMFVELPASNRRSGYSLKTRAGLKLSVIGEEAQLDSNSTGGKFKLNCQPSNDPYRLFFYESIPSTFTENSILPVRKYPETAQKTFSFGHSYFGVGLTLNSKQGNAYSIDLIKSFFHKSSRYESFYGWPDWLFAGSRGFLDHAIFNPAGHPAQLDVVFDRHSSYPTDKFSIAVHRSSEALSEENIDSKNAWLGEKYCLNLTGEGGGVVRRWESEMTLSKTWPLETGVKFVADFLRSPIPDYDNQSYHVDVGFDTQFSDYTHILIDPTTEENKPISMTFNSSLLTRSKNISSWINILGNGTHVSAENEFNSSVFNKCKEDKEKGFHLSFSCWLLGKIRGRLSKFDFIVNYKQLPKIVKTIASSVYNWLVNRFVYNLESRTPFYPVPEKQVQMQFNFSQSNPTVDIQMTKSQLTQRFTNLFIPSLLPYYEPITVTNSIAERFLENSLYIHQAKCIVSGDYVQTTDRVVYKTPTERCYHVVLADCNSKRLLVLVRQHDRTNKALRVFFDIDQVDIQPDAHSEELPTNLSATVNGANVLATDEWLYVHRPDDSSSWRPFTIYLYASGLVIDAPAYGLHVFFDGHNLALSVTNWLRGRQCGLCGNFDGEKTIEFIGPDGTAYKNATLFAGSYIIQEEE